MTASVRTYLGPHNMPAVPRIIYKCVTFNESILFFLRFSLVMRKEESANSHDWIVFLYILKIRIVWLWNTPLLPPFHLINKRSLKCSMCRRQKLTQALTLLQTLPIESPFRYISNLLWSIKVAMNIVCNPQPAKAVWICSRRRRRILDLYFHEGSHTMHVFKSQSPIT